MITELFQQALHID